MPEFAVTFMAVVTAPDRRVEAQRLAEERARVLRLPAGLLKQSSTTRDKE